ncbi:MAG: glycosyltransferase family 4 protein [Schwartzia sp. (in: firmicutes)]
MMTVAFTPLFSEEWIGGINYYRNLCSAVARYESEHLHIKIFLPCGQEKAIFDEFPPEIEVHETLFLTRWSIPWILRKLWLKCFGHDGVLAWYLRRQKVDVISHQQSPVRCAGMHNIGWIPDFQHKYLPDFFTKKEINGRDLAFARLAEKMDTVVLSSQTAKDDFIQYYPQYAEKARVLRFVPAIDFSARGKRDEVRKKYALPDKFFFLPNQYWVHKNHKIVLEALRILKEQGKVVHVVSTGNTKDYRNPGYFAALQDWIRQYDIGDRYIILGMVPYADVQSLAEAAWAYINPSLFEGWSTTVEEAKYRGKPILLSDLKVHREQAPKKGVYFNPMDPNELAEKMWQMWNRDDMKEEEIAALEIAHQKAMKAFAETYCGILGEGKKGIVLERHG